MTLQPTVEVIGPIWHDDRAERTPLGLLVEAAKDHGAPGALDALVAAAEAWAAERPIDLSAVVVAVPPSPDRPNPLVAAAARAFAMGWGVAVDDAIVRHQPTARLRDVDPDVRPEMVRQAQYEVVGPVAGRAVVLVDDVVLSGATLAHCAQLLLDAGAASVRLVAVARARRA